jgi:hypothetical protein
MTQVGCGPGHDGTFPISGPVTLVQSGTNLTGAGNFSIPLLGASATFQLTGTANGNIASASFTETNSFGQTETGLFNGILIGNALAINASGTVAGSTCSFTLPLTGSRQ